MNNISVANETIKITAEGFYEVDGKLYFGEMTFTSSAGMNSFYTREFLLKLGSLTKLPIDKLS